MSYVEESKKIKRDPGVKMYPSVPAISSLLIDKDEKRTEAT